jgi:hypothetical protein
MLAVFDELPWFSVHVRSSIEGLSWEADGCYLLSVSGSWLLFLVVGSTSCIYRSRFSLSARFIHSRSLRPVVVLIMHVQFDET